MELRHGLNAPLTAQCRNIERCIIQEEMKPIRPFNMFNKNVMASSQAICEKGNHQKVKSQTTLRKMNSENKAKLDYDKKDAFVDLYKLQMKQIYSYIKVIRSPRAVHLYSKEVLTCIK